jgi:proteasome accessory factor B
MQSENYQSKSTNLGLVSQAKTERLVNLTMALLATKRYLKKSEIFEKVAGYSGGQETKERMFERDKDDLRSLGIEIEVASHDPLFEDEPGYRIIPETYQLPLQQLNDSQRSILSTALALWQASEFESEAISAARRISGIGELIDESFTLPTAPIELTQSGLIQVAKALATRSSLRFKYQKLDGTPAQVRQIHPFGLSTWRGSWYVIGEDLDKNDIRAFKLSRVVTEFEVGKKREAYEIPADFAIKDYLVMLNKDLVKVEWLARKGQAHPLRLIALEIEDFDEEWDKITTEFESNEEAVAMALWNFDSTILTSPEDLSKIVKDSLRMVVKTHG